MSQHRQHFYIQYNREAASICLQQKGAPALSNSRIASNDRDASNSRKADNDRDASNSKDAAITGKPDTTRIYIKDATIRKVGNRSKAR